MIRRQSLPSSLCHHRIWKFYHMGRQEFKENPQFLCKEPNRADRPTVIRDNIDWLRDVTIFDQSVQPRSPAEVNNNPCFLGNNGGCTISALLCSKSQTPKCDCAFGTLQADGKSCAISSENSLIFALMIP